MLTHYYKPGYMVDGDLINDKNVIDAIKDLEIGKYTEKAITVQSKYDYIIKRVDLTEKAYKHADENAEDKTYAALFKDYVTAVETKTYSDKIEEMAKSVVVNTAVTSKYTMQGTYLSKMFGQ
jgi:enoyl reductase-like protein